MSKNKYSIEEALNSSKSVDWKVGSFVMPVYSTDSINYDIASEDISGGYSHIVINTKVSFWMTFAADTNFTWNGTSSLFPGGAGLFFPTGTYMFPIPQYVDTAYSNTQLANTTNTDIGYSPVKIKSGDPIYLRARTNEGGTVGNRSMYYWLM